MRDARYQVLRDDGDTINCRTKQEARAVAARLKREGAKGVSIWDVYNNPLSKVLNWNRTGRLK